MTRLRNMVWAAHLAFALCFCYMRAEAQSVRFLGRYEIPLRQEKNTVFGGISGIDYDSARGIFYLISDDRSIFNPARFYKASISIRGDSIERVSIDSVIFLRDTSGLYAAQTVDLETIRYHPKGRFFVVGSEGGKFSAPSISLYSEDGVWMREAPIDKIYIAQQRDNKSFEAMDFSQDKKSIFYCSEGPLFYDGDEPDTANGSILRIRKQSLSADSVEQEIQYTLEKLPQQSDSIPPRGGAAVDNGLSELLVLDDRRFLTLERSGAYRGSDPYTLICRLFLVTVIPKKDENGRDIFYGEKKELFDFSSLPYPCRNMEGMCLGPKLKNGKPSLLLVSDNNFIPEEPTAFYLMALDDGL